MFIFQNCACCKSKCAECVHDYKPPDSITMEITTGTLHGGPSLGVTAAVQSMLHMTLTLPIQNKKAYEFGYDKDTRAGNITYLLPFTPTQITKPAGMVGEAYLAQVIIHCNGLYSVGWDNQHGGANLPWRIDDTYDLYVNGWGRRTGTGPGQGLDYNTYETAARDSLPLIRQSELCAPPRYTLTKTYHYPMYVYPEFGGSVMAIVNRAAPTPFYGAYSDSDDCPNGDCNQIILTVGPSTPPPPKVLL